MRSDYSGPRWATAPSDAPIRPIYRRRNGPGKSNLATSLSRMMDTQDDLENGVVDRPVTVDVRRELTEISNRLEEISVRVEDRLSRIDERLDRLQRYAPQSFGMSFNDGEAASSDASASALRFDQLPDDADEQAAFLRLLADSVEPLPAGSEAWATEGLDSASAKVRGASALLLSRACGAAGKEKIQAAMEIETDRFALAAMKASLLGFEI